MYTYIYIQIFGGIRLFYQRSDDPQRDVSWNPLWKITKIRKESHPLSTSQVEVTRDPVMDWSKWGTSTPTGWWLGKNPSEKYDCVNWDDLHSQIIWENKKMATKPPTSQKWLWSWPISMFWGSKKIWSTNRQHHNVGSRAPEVLVVSCVSKPSRLRGSELSVHVYAHIGYRSRPSYLVLTEKPRP